MSAIARTLDPRWIAAADEHRVAVAAYLESADGLDEGAWKRPWATGKWTPAQITEHLTLSYEALLAELCEGRAMALKMTPWRRRLSRWIILPHILFHRSFPLRVPAPREIRPGPPRAGQKEALRALEQLAERFEERLQDAYLSGGGGLTHPYFGPVDPVRGLRFVAVHLEHHRRQVARAAD
jgi:hypothetical protein